MGTVGAQWVYLDKCFSTYLDGHSGYIWMNMFTIRPVPDPLAVLSLDNGPFMNDP